MAGIASVGALGSLTATGGATSILGGATASVGGPGALDGPGGATGSGQPGPGSADGFLDSLSQALSGLNTQLTDANQAMGQFAAGGSSADLGTVMLQMQEASLSLNLGTQVRNGLLDAYRQIMALQV